jgi:hypothetical protein
MGVSDASATAPASSPGKVPVSSPVGASPVVASEAGPASPALMAVESLPHPAAYPHIAAKANHASTIRELIVHSSDASRSLRVETASRYRGGGTVHVQPVAPAVQAPPASDVHWTPLQHSLVCAHAWP